MQRGRTSFRKQKKGKKKKKAYITNGLREVKEDTAAMENKR